jgi:carboxypeptidase C (cathepsin A)
MWSGYLKIGETQKQLHYIFVESQSKPEKDPLLIWFNGGPGCSSMGGMMAEHGPWVIEDGDHKFTKNDWSWNREANVLYYNQPAGVGFSICDNGDECWFDDESVSHDNLAALNYFLEVKFPEFKDNDIYISGESYAGIYVPYLAYRIHEHN